MEDNINTKIKQSFNWARISVFIFYCLVFLLPIFFLATAIAPVIFGKSLLIYGATTSAFIFWIISRLQEGELKIPKSGLLLAAGGIIASWLISSIFSLIPSISFMGMGYEIGTFFFFLFLCLALFLISILFQDEQRAMIFYFALFLSSAIVFIFQLFQTVFKIKILPSIFQVSTDNLIGSWNDFAIFFGFIGLTALSLFALFRFSRVLKTMFLILIILSLLAMLAVNFSTAWIIFGLFILVLFVYLSFTSLYFPASWTKLGISRKSIILSIFILLLALFFILARGLIGELVDTLKLNTNIIEVRPSWSSTFEITQQALKEDPILGSGPNTFFYDWMRFKPKSINDTIFWNTRFQSGASYLASMVATTGILGILSFLTFLGFLFYYGTKVLSYSEDDFKKVLLISSFLGSLYLWSFVIFYSPGFLIFALAFLTTGILTATLVRAGKINSIEISLLKNQKTGFVSILLIVFLVMGAVSSLYLLFQKYWAVRSYTFGLRAVNIMGDIDKGEAAIARAGRIDAQDRYFRDLSEIGIIRMREILSQQDVSGDTLRSQFQDALGLSIQNAQTAVNLNSLDPLNWIQLARIYEAVVPFKIAGADTLAINAYQEALNRSPSDPSPFLGMARVQMAAGKMQEARDYLQSALDLKADFASAFFLLSQIEAQEGNLDGAIQKMEQTALIAPNDVGVLFQLGLLYYQKENYDGGRAVLERAVALDPNYSNARYFLGLIYNRQKSKDKAIEQFEAIEQLNPDNTEVKKILENLRSGKDALSGISPPEKFPEERREPPIKEESLIKD